MGSGERRFSIALELIIADMLLLVQYIPTTFEALPRGWPTVPFPSRASSSSKTPLKPRRPPEPPSTVPPSTPFENPALIAGPHSPDPPFFEEADVDQEIVYEASQGAVREERAEREEERDRMATTRQRLDELDEKDKADVFPKMNELPWEDDGFADSERTRLAALEEEEGFTDDVMYDENGMIAIESYEQVSPPSFSTVGTY